MLVTNLELTDAVPEFISQRRRWLNGAFFAAVYSLIHFRQVWNTDHTLVRKVLLHVEFIYQFINLLFTFFSLVRCPPLISKWTNEGWKLILLQGKFLPNLLFHRRFIG